MDTALTMTTLPPWGFRMRKVAAALWVLARDPRRLDQVLAFMLYVNLPSVVRAVNRVESDPDGQRLFRERPYIDREHVDWAALGALPEGTVGRAYYRFIHDNGLSPAPFEDIPYDGDPKIRYAILRLRQTHDLWHVLTGYHMDTRGEILLQAFVYGQLRLPSAFVMSFFGSIRYAMRWKGHWAELRHSYERGKATRYLATFCWEDHWATPVETLRVQLGCPT